MGRSSDSLRAVLLGAWSSSGTGSKPGGGSSGLTWHSLKSAAPTRDLDPPGHYFPAKLAMSTGLIKIFFSILMLALGGLSFVMKSPLSSLGAGIWVGTVVGVSGFLGVCAARRPYAQVYVISFMSVSILSLAASGLLVVLSATSWARDNQKPEIVVYDKETQSELDLFGEILINSPSILVSGFLVVLGILDILTSLACVALSAREACGSQSSSMGVFAVAHDGHDKKERLYRWLGQQKNIFQVTSSPNGGDKGVPTVPQFVPLSSSGGTSACKKDYPKLSPPTGARLADPLLRPVLVKSKTSQSSNLLSSSSNPLSSSSGNSSSDGLLNKRGTAKKSKTSKVSQSSSDQRTSSSVYFIHPELLKEENRSRVTSSSKKTHKKSSDSSKHPSYGPYSLPIVAPSVESMYHHAQNYHRDQQAAYQYHHHQEMLAQQQCQPTMYHSLPCPKHHRRQYVPQQYPGLYYHQNITQQHLMNPYAGLEPYATKSMTKGKRKVSEIYASALMENEKLKKKDKKKRRKEKRKREEERIKRRNIPLTDEQIDNSYTGLDREIAEGFITLTMEPAVSQRKSGGISSSDQESF